jgi:Tfp pilus assembly protein PilF
MKKSRKSAPLNNDECFAFIIFPFQEASELFWQTAAESCRKIWPNAAVTSHLQGLAEKEDFDALPHYHEALKKDADFWRAGLACAVIHYNAGNWGTAIQHLDQCLEKESAQEVAYIHFLKATCLNRLERYGEETDAYRAGLAVEPNWPNARFSLGQSLLLQGNEQEALVAFDDAIQHEENSRQALWYKIKTLERLGINEEATTQRNRLATAPTAQPRTLLFTWNPNKTPWDTLDEEAVFAEKTGIFISDWSCGRMKNIHPGDRCFLHCQGKGPKGVIGEGTVISDVWQEAHWDPEQARAGKKANYIDIEWSRVLNPATFPPLPRELLLEQFPQVNWDTQTSGIVIKEEVVDRLSQAWKAHIDSL